MEFARKYQNKKFNQIEPDKCIIYQMLSASFKRERGGEIECNTVKRNLHRSYSQEIKAETDEFDEDLEESKLTSEIQNTVSNSPEVLFEDGTIKSNCPICLEILSGNDQTWIS